MMRRLIVLVSLPLLLGSYHTPQAGGMDPELAIAPSRLPQRLDESTSAVTILDREMLREAGVRRIADILRLVPGMIVGSRSPAIQPATYLGLSDDYARRVQVLVDGLSIYAPSTGAVLWQDLPLSLEDIERIEVVRGPNTAAYGSHALLATIKIMTVSPREVARWSMAGAVGQNGLHDAYLRLAGSEPSSAWMLSFQHQEDDGLAVFSSGLRRNGLGGRRLDALRMKGEHELLPDTELQWQLGLARAQNGRGAEVSLDVSATINDAFRDDNNHQFLSLHHRAAPGSEWVVRLARLAQHYQEPKDDRRILYVHAPLQPLLFPPQPELLSLNRSYQATRWEAELEHHIESGRRLRAVWGVGLRREEAQGASFFGTSETQRLDSARLFGHAEWRFAPAWVLNGGAMLERTSLHEAVLTPRLTLIHHLDPHHTLRLGWSTGTRQPLLFENQGRTAAWRANGEPVWLTLASGALSGGLTPERASEWSLGYLWLPDRDTQFDLRLFHLRLEDPIRAMMRIEQGVASVLYPSGTQWWPLVLDMRNAGAVRVQGAEALLDTRLSSKTSLHLNYAFLQAREQTPLEVGWPDYAASVPRQAAGFMLTERLAEGWDVTLRGHYASPLQWGFVARERLEPQKSLGLRLGYVHTFGQQRVRVDLLGEHLNGRLVDFDPGRGWERTFWLRLALEGL